MGTEVLRPQNCLIDRIRVAPVVFPRRRPNRKPAARPERPDPRKRSIQPEASSSTKPSSFFDLRSDRFGGGAQVTILRRGESLDSKIKSKALSHNGGGVTPEMIACGTERIGPEPEMVPKQIRIRGARSGSPTPRARPDMYAGSAFALSPAPSSLPLPSFYKRDQVLFGAAVDDSATRDLRRILRLD